MALLISKGADINAKDVAGRNPLHIASFYNHTECVKILLENKADTF